MDFRTKAAPPPPIMLGDTPLSCVKSFMFLGITISQDLKWEHSGPPEKGPAAALLSPAAEEVQALEVQDDPVLQSHY